MRKRSFILLLISFGAASTVGKVPRAESTFADFDGVKIHYIDIGKGSKAFVFIHGWACNADFWKQGIHALPQYRVIAIDLPGHGKSDKPKRDYTMDYFARSIGVVMRNAHVESAVLVGHSMGASVIRRFALDYPDRTLGLVVVDGSLEVPTKDDVEAAVLPLLANYKKGAARFIDQLLEPIRDTRLKRAIRTEMLSTPDYVGLSAMREMGNQEGIAAGKKIAVPVMAILARSPWWKADTESAFRSIAPNLDFQMWDGVSHFLMLEKPAAFNEAIALFVSSNGLL
jgi:pimeloyl-ACP methyl ester carboxylesterase